MKSSGSFWFWILPPLLVVGAFVAYRVYLEDRLRDDNDEADAAPPPPPAEKLVPPSSPPAAPEPSTSTPHGDSPPPGQPAPLPQTPETISVPPPPKPIEDLQRAQAMLPELVSTVTSHPQAVLWLRNKHLLRRFVGAVDCIANGVSPRLHLDFFRPKGKFAVRKTGTKLVVDPAAYRRYNVVATVFESLDPKGCRTDYTRLQPVLDGLYTDLGYPDGTFSDCLTKAVRALLGTPVIDAGAGLRPSGSVYQWSDPDLEKLGEPQKHLLRMGPENVRRIKQKLRDLSAALDLPVDQ